MKNKISIVDTNGNPINMSAFDGASSGYGGELAGWSAQSYSADSALLPDFDTGNARAADAARNQAYAKSGVQLHIDHIVGSQFKLVYKPNYAVLGLDRNSQEVKDFVKDVEARFTDYAEDPDCYIDAERKRTFTMFMREGAGTHCKTGEITSKAEWIPNRRGTKLATAIKNIDYARITNPNNVMDTNRLRGGVKMDRHGAAVGYYVSKSHPSDYWSGAHFEKRKWLYVPRYLKWGRLQFMHVFEPEGSDQTRGINGLFTALRKMKMLEKFQDTALQNAIINAMYAAVIKSDMPSEEIFKALGSDNVEQSNFAKFMKFKAQWSSQANIKMNGSKIPHLLPNEDLELKGINAPSSSLSEFESGILRNIASSLGVSYEQLAKDFSKTNYSSARASINESFRYFMGKRATIIARYATMIFQLWFEESLNIGLFKLPKGASGFYDAKSAWTKCAWIGAGKSQIDGLKEVKESIEKIRAGLSTYEKEIANYGEDYVEVFEQQYREAEMLAEQGRTPLWQTGGVTDDAQESNGEDENEDEAGKTNPNPEVHENA